MKYSIELKDQIYVKGYGFASFAENVAQNLRQKI